MARMMERAKSKFWLPADDTSSASRPELVLPEEPDDSSGNQRLPRCPLQSLISTETAYIASLENSIETLNNVKWPASKSDIIKSVVGKAETILEIHNQFHVELAAQLANLYTGGSIGKTIISAFSKQNLVNDYSEYINNVEAAFEAIRNLQITRPRSISTRNPFLRQTSRTNGVNYVNLSSDMIKPVQRFPQLILLIKDILKYTPADYHDRCSLQEALTDVENIACQLNERKMTSEQLCQGQAILRRLESVNSERTIKKIPTLRIRSERLRLVYSRDPNSRQKAAENQVHLLDTIIAFDNLERNTESQRHDQEIWYHDMTELKLTTNTQLLNRLTRSYADGVLKFPTVAGLSINPGDVVGEIQKLRSDIHCLQFVLAAMKTLNRKYDVCEHVEATITNIETEIQKHFYELLRMVHHRYILLQDRARDDALMALCTDSPEVKQAWCTDFLLAKCALEDTNRPSWVTKEREHGIEDIGDRHVNKQPALLLRKASIQAGRDNTLLQLTVKCAVHVSNSPSGHNPGEFIWLCSSNAIAGCVSVVPLNSNKPNYSQTFKVTDCEIICAERVLEMANTWRKVRDTVWISTNDSKILVFAADVSYMYNQFRNEPLRVLRPGSPVVCMLYVDQKVVCGTSRGLVLVYEREAGILLYEREAGISDDEWSCSHQVELGSEPVSSISCVGETLWAACGCQIHVIQRSTYTIQHSYTYRDNVAQLVKSGTGVWASLHGKPEIELFHSETGQELQRLSVLRVVREFLQKCDSTQDDVECSFEVTSLSASLGLLWVGTSNGVILTYPLPKLRASVPKICQRSHANHVAFHGHSGQIKYLLPMKYDLLSGLAEPIEPASLTSDVLTENSLEDDTMHNTSMTANNTQEQDMASDEIEIDELGNDVKSEHHDNLVNLSGSSRQIDTIYPSLLNSNTGTLPEATRSYPSMHEDNATDNMETVSDSNAIGKSGNDERPTNKQREKLSNCNTILVVSGGNGYRDRRNLEETQDSHDKDPCMLFWVYKI